jgi:hypothetical protein
MRRRTPRLSLFCGRTPTGRRTPIIFYHMIMANQPHVEYFFARVVTPMSFQRAWIRASLYSPKNICIHIYLYINTCMYIYICV